MTEITLREDFERAALAGTEQTADLQPALNEARQRARYAQLMTIRQGLMARQQRGRFFNSNLFADPAWDMLLELYAAALTQRKLTVSRLAERSCVPMTTALRWISALEKEGLIERSNDRLDGRRVFLTLTDKGERAMSDYFDDLPAGTLFL